MQPKFYLLGFWISFYKDWSLFIIHLFTFDNNNLLFSHQECLIFGSRNSSLHSFGFSLSMIGVCMQVILGSCGVELSSTPTWYQSSISSCPYFVYERFDLAFKSVLFYFKGFHFSQLFCIEYGGSLIFGSL